MHSKRQRMRDFSARMRGKAGLVLALVGTASSAGADGFFGGSDLDFWKEGKRVAPAVRTSAPMPAETPLADESLPLPSGSIIRQRDALPFDWKRYESPANPEFWDDGGDYVAPRPLREAVTHPTRENLTRYVAWQAKRLEVVAAFSEKLAVHAMGAASAGDPGNLPGAQSAPARSMTAVPARKASPVRWSEVEILYFYQSSCPHCQAAKDHVEDLARRGARVSYIQLDAGERPPLHAGSIAYTREHSAQFAITATPTWILRRRTKVVRLEGEQGEGALTSQAASLFNSEGPS